MKLTFKVVESLGAIAPADWDALAPGEPLVSHAYLHALHESGSAVAEKGWYPQYITAWRGDSLVGAVPLYVKGHSYGEYVFDWAWADAYHRHGVHYYPKLLAAVPFTPVTGARLMTQDDEVAKALATELLDLARSSDVSSLHLLFPNERDVTVLAAHTSLMRRSGVQFHWRNDGYANFDAFLASMSHDKRKRIKQERRKVREAGVVCDWRIGSEITEADWTFFYKCYVSTYRAHHSTPYLTRDFFDRIARQMPQHILLVRCLRDGVPIAASLCIIDDTHIYGRYWGSAMFLSGLHFEACYYQPIEFAIAHKLQIMEGGAQGEHKLARGLLPATTHSFHWLRDQRFAGAVREFLHREGRGMEHYVNELEDRAPFRQDVL